MKNMNGSGGDDEGHASSSNRSKGSATASNNNNNGALRPQGMIAKKKNPEDVHLFLRRLKQYLLYSKLRSLIPPTPQQQQQQQPPFDDHHQFGMHEEDGIEEAIEVEMELHEIPIAYKSDSEHDEENNVALKNQTKGNDYDDDDDLVLDTNEKDEDEDDNDDDEDNTCTTTIVFESDDDEKEEGSKKAFVPSVKIEKMEDSIIINTVVLKQKALTSSLFKILEEEKLDIVFENQYRTETKVCHTIQVKLVQPADYNVDLLKNRLQTWARGEPEPEPMS